MLFWLVCAGAEARKRFINPRPIFMRSESDPNINRFAVSPLQQNPNSNHRSLHSNIAVMWTNVFKIVSFLLLTFVNMIYFVLPLSVS